MYEFSNAIVHLISLFSCGGGCLEVPRRPCYYSCFESPTHYNNIDNCYEWSICLNAFNLFVLSTNFRRTDFVDFAKSWLIFQNGGGHRPR